MCDDAENLAGAGTDVRRCSNALGPRKNLQEQVQLGLARSNTMATMKLKYEQVSLVCDC
jgi:hypothetical protein